MTRTPSPPKTAAEQSVEAALNAEQREVLEKATRLLQNVGSPKIAARALTHGYDDAEHQHGWTLCQRASGATRPLTHFVSQADQTAILSDEKARAAIRAVDAFENHWFSIVEGVLKRFVKGDKAEALLAGFFKDLTQQPEGPGVLRSVSVLLDRVAELATDNTPGAKEAHAALVKRGLNADTVTQTRDLIAQAQQFAPALPVANAAEIAQATADQRAAFEELSLWYNDWANTFRSVFDYHAQVRLGLIKRKGGTDSKKPSVDATLTP